LSPPFLLAVAFAIMGGADVASLVKGPKEGYLALAEKGRQMTQETSAKVLLQSIIAGCYIGFGALLAVSISATMPGLTAENPGLKKLVFAFLFPVNLVLITLSGGILFTGASAAGPAAFFEKQASWKSVVRCLFLSWVGNLLGALLFGEFMEWCELIDRHTQEAFLEIAVHKTSARFDVTVARGIGCNWMVCMAVFLSGQAQDMFGKVVAIYLPISTFVMLGFEHVPANFFLLGVTFEDGDMSVLDLWLKNWIPATLGNFLGGALLVAATYSCIFGELGRSPWVTKIARDVPADKMETETDLEAAGCQLHEEPAKA